jgi:hypothetical protein
MESGLLPAQGRRRKGRWVADVRARLISDREKKRRERRGAGLGERMGRLRVWAGGKGEGDGPSARIERGQVSLFFLFSFISKPFQKQV